MDAVLLALGIACAVYLAAAMLVLEDRPARQDRGSP